MFILQNNFEAEFTNGTILIGNKERESIPLYYHNL